jgi:hypothetical protein
MLRSTTVAAQNVDMGSSRIPGPLCGSKLPFGWINDGTLVREKSPNAGPLCAPSPLVSDTELEAAWFGYIDSMVFDVEPSQGILWAKIGEARATEIAQGKGAGFRVINMILQKNGFLARYAAAFEDRKSELTYRIWERVSLKYVSSLKGQVTVYVDQAEFGSSIVHSNERVLPVGRRSGAWNPPMPVLVTELEQAIDSNPAITSIKMIDERTRKIVGTYFKGVAGSTH